MAIQFKAGRARRYSVVLLLLLATGYALKDAAVDYWQEELQDYRRLEDTQIIPGLSAHDLADLEEIGVLIFGDGGQGNQP